MYSEGVEGDRNWKIFFGGPTPQNSEVLGYCIFFYHFNVIFLSASTTKSGSDQTSGIGLLMELKTEEL